MPDGCFSMSQCPDKHLVGDLRVKIKDVMHDGLEMCPDPEALEAGTGPEQD